MSMGYFGSNLRRLLREERRLFTGIFLGRESAQSRADEELSAQEKRPITQTIASLRTQTHFRLEFQARPDSLGKHLQLRGIK